MMTHEDETHLSKTAAAIVADIRERQARDPRVMVSRKVSQEMLGIGPSRQIELEAEGVLHSYLDGSGRRVLVSSIYARMIAQAIASHLLNGPPARFRQPSKRFSHKPRPRTESELEGLRKGNERRREEARARRAAGQFGAGQSVTEV
jgi:hypothetical protein